MNDSEDLKILDWMDQLNSEDLDGLSGFEPFEDELLEEAAWMRIKKRTFAQLNLHEPEKRVIVPLIPLKKPHLKRWVYAACAVFLLCTVILSTSGNVRAELKKVLQFIPGFGYVDEIDEALEITYVLDKPLITIGKFGKVTVDAVLIQGVKAQIALSGDQVAAASIESIFLNTEQGQYEFMRDTASWGSSGPWVAGYHYAGTIPLNGLDRVSIQLGEMVLGPLYLTETRKADNMLGLGPSDLRNGIQITGVMTSLEGNQSKINLLTQLPEGQVVDSFGKEPISNGLQLHLVDKNANPIEIIKDVGFSKPQELLIKAPTDGTESYQLTIPSIKILDQAIPHQKVTLPVPAKGSQPIHVTIDMGGLPMDFTRVERIDATSVRFDVDLHFDATQPKTLQGYKLFAKDGSNSFSYSSTVNENTRAIEMEWLDVEPGKKEITFYVGEPQIVIKGPWVLRNLQ